MTAAAAAAAARLLPADSRLYQALRRPRLAGPVATVAVLDTGYHLQAECAAALGALGQRPVRVAIDARGAAAEAQARLLRALVATPCDWVLTVNHLGLDQDGATQALLARIGMPLVSWFVDSPPFILGRAHHLDDPNVLVACWERAYLPLLARAGAHAPLWLPLALDPATMAPAAVGAPPRYRLTFVGDSMQHAQQKWDRRLGPRGRRRAAALAAALLADRGALVPAVAAAWAEAGAGHGGRDDALDIVAHATFTATARYRLGLLQALVRARLAPVHVFGDPGWRAVLPAARYMGPVRYGAPLAAVYRQGELTLSATSLQMPGAFNQRALDAPGCGAAVLMDAQADVATLLGEAAAPLVYAGAAALVERAAALLADPAAAAAAAAAVGAVVRRRHTYRDRLARLLAELRRRLGAEGAPPALPDGRDGRARA